MMTQTELEKLRVETAETRTVFVEVELELERATRKFGKFNSAHEGYAILLEEVDELWDEVKKKPDNRFILDMRKEAIQVAAMALRFARDICGTKN